jgi:hypothetical protein
MSSLRIAAALALLGANAHAAAPRLYATPGMQSPTRAAGDDLLLIAGYPLSPADQVVYREFTGTDWPAQAGVPAASSASEGVALVLAEASDEHALVVRLPGVLDARRAYQIAVRNTRGEWSNPIRINDPRVYWMSPAELTANGARAGLDRRLRLVGANLAPAANGALQVRLRGSADFEMRSITPREGLADYLAEVELPDTLPAGEYRLSVSRDGRAWSEPAQPLRVAPAIRPA